MSLFRDTHKCTKNNDESLASFANRCNSLVARQSIKTCELYCAINRQYTVSMIQKANISVATWSSLIFKLTTNCHSQLMQRTVLILVSLFDCLSTVITSSSKNQKSEMEKLTIINELNMVEDRLSLNRDRGSSHLNLDIVSATLRQFTFSNEISLSTLLLTTPNLRAMYVKLSNIRQKNISQKNSQAALFAKASVTGWSITLNLKTKLKKSKNCYKTRIACPTTRLKGSYLTFATKLPA